MLRMKDDVLYVSLLMVLLGSFWSPFFSKKISKNKEIPRIINLNSYIWCSHSGCSTILVIELPQLT
jgi:hypothetical protein